VIKDSRSVGRDVFASEDHRQDEGFCYLEYTQLLFGCVSYLVHYPSPFTARPPPVSESAPVGRELFGQAVPGIPSVL
jgi:hypothetical protein